MDDLLEEITKVEKTEQSIISIISYVAFNYHNNITVFETLKFKNIISDCSYNYILDRLVDHVQENYRNVYIDKRSLMTYLDCFYEID